MNQIKNYSFVLIASIALVLTFSSCNKNIAASKSPKQYYYTCPMHTEVFEMRPGRCPKCGMPLEQYDLSDYSERRSSGSHSSSHGSGGHSGGCH